MQEKFSSEAEAKRQAAKLCGKHRYVQVVESDGKYYVETPPDCSMIRRWETVIVNYEHGRKIRV